jgi:predicted dehydrogenase
LTTVAGKVRWGFLGTGKIARILAQALRDSECGELVAIGSRNRDRATAFAAEFGGPRVHDYPGVIEDAAVDIVYVATHHPLHREWAIRAVEAGKGVLCEKPIGMSRAEAVEIAEAARRRGAFLMEAFAYRCHPQTTRLVQLLRSGRIGDVRMIDAVFGYDAGPAPANYLMDRELGGGSILDVGCYTTSMAHLAAAAAAGVQVVPTVNVAAAGSTGPTGVDHASAATLTFDGGLLARVACSIQANLQSSVRIFGSGGWLEIPSPWLPGRFGPPPSIRLERWDAAPELIEIPAGKDVYRIEVDEVSRMVRGGERSPAVMPWEDSVANMATLDRWRSAIGLRYPGESAAENAPHHG